MLSSSEANAELLEADWRAGLLPEPLLTVSEWADTHRMLSPKATSEAGVWRTDRTPYLRDIMDALSTSSPYTRIVFQKGAQIGGTEAGNNWLGFIMHHASSPTLAVQPTVELAKRFSRQRLDTMIEATPVLRRLVAPQKARDGSNTLTTKEFPGGLLIMTGANSAVGLRSMPARYLFLDEIDAYPPSADEEGDPIALAEARTATFGHRRKILLVSTPTIKGVSRIEREYQSSDQRRFFVPCPECDTMQWLQFPNLKWDRGRPKSVMYYCEGCGAGIAERHKASMLPKGQWRPTVTSSNPYTIGFHLSSLYSPLGWLSWTEIAARHERDREQDETLKTFVNTVLGETWAETGEVPDWENLAARGEDYRIGTVPARALLLCYGVDVQKDRIEVGVWAWGRERECWLVEHRVLMGDTARDQVWLDLTSMVDETWPHELGGSMQAHVVAIDSGAYTQEVYAWARTQDQRIVRAVKGYERGPALVGATTYVEISFAGRTIRRGLRVTTVIGNIAKLELYGALRKPVPDKGEPFPAGYVHLPKVDAETLKQLTAEQLVTHRDRHGYAKTQWQNTRGRNEVLDCFCYARAAAALMGVDRFGETHWAELERRLNISRERESENKIQATSNTQGIVKESISAQASASPVSLPTQEAAPRKSFIDPSRRKKWI